MSDLPPDFPIVVYHNPRCSTSRAALARLTDNGYAPQVVEYLQTGWDKDTLKGLAKQAGGLKALLRAKEPLAVELGLKSATDAVLLKAMIAHPILVKRPIVSTPKGAVVARPMTQINAVLDRVIAE